MTTSDEWTEVKSNSKIGKNIQTKREIDLVKIQDIIKNILIKYNAKACFIFGSAVKKKKYPNDIDILVIWKKNKYDEIPLNIMDIKLELEVALQYPVDLISMLYKGKDVIFDSRCEIFLNDHIIPDSITVFGEKDYIYKSQYKGKN